MTESPYVCPSSVYGLHSSPDVDGCCAWCGHEIREPMPPEEPPDADFLASKYRAAVSRGEPRHDDSVAFLEGDV